MSVSKVWSLAAGLFFISVLASTLQASAAMPKSAKMDKDRSPSDAVYQRALVQPLSDQGLSAQIPAVYVGCALAKGAAHQIAQCSIGELDQ